MPDNNIRRWLDRYLTRRDLKQPDQRPLYGYHTTAGEYLELRDLLRHCHARSGFMDDKAEAAGFCLFCADWYRREYSTSDGWSWEPIWRSLGCEISGNKLGKIIPKGLVDYWQRPIRFYDASERRNFLGSLFSEGGLPFLVLTEQGSRFQTLFTRILKQGGAAQQLAGSLEPVVKNQIELLNLPQVFREQTSVELIVNMADQLAQLVGLYQLQQKPDPVDVLDRSYPRWRESFPIPLDDETGRGFLNGLLTTASKEARKTSPSSSSLACEHFWQSISESLETEITLPVELSMTVNRLPASNRFDLSIHEGRTLLASVGPAYGVVSEKLIKVRVRQQKLVCRRKDPSKALSVVASIGGQVVGAVDIPGSILDLGIVPVGFDSRDGGLRWPLVGQSSFTTRVEELSLLVPENALVSSEDCVVAAQNTSAFGTRIWQVSGRGSLTCSQDDVFSIRLGGAQAVHSRIELRGKLLDYPTRPSATYIGLPKVSCVPDAPAEVSNARLFLNGTAADACHLNKRLGSQWLTAKSAEGQTWLRRRVGILPADFQVELQPGDSPNHGYIRFKSSVNCFVEFVSEHLKVRRLTDGKCIAYELNSELDIPPSQVAVRVCPNLESDPIDIQLPFPTVGVVALDANEQPLPKTLSVDGLLGSRLYLFSRPDRSVQYRIEMRLANRPSSRAFYHWSYRADPERPVEVSLYELRSNIESLLSLEDGIDQKVVLTISGDGRDSEYRIRRHAADLERDWNRNVLFSSALASGDEKSIRPVLMLLSEPERKAQEIVPRRSEGVATGEFDIPDFVQKNGPWLVLPHKDSSVSFRPVFIEGNHSKPESAEDIRSLQRAVLAFDHKALVSAFMPVLQQMAQNPGHSGWQFLKSLFDQYNYLSLATFEVWRALLKHPDALAMSLYKFSFEPEYIQHLEKDFPTVWETWSASVLKTAGLRYWDWMVEQGMPVEILDAHLKPDFATRLAACIPMLHGDPLKWLEDGSLPQEIQLPEALMHHVIQSEWYQGLLRNHDTDDQWPHDFGKRLKRWAQSQPSNLLGFEPEQDYRNAVVYLPVYLAAVSSGREQLESSFPNMAEAAFHIRQTRDFDTDWFRSVYQYALLKFISISQKEVATQ
jgi:hypothetical protein